MRACGGVMPMCWTNSCTAGKVGQAVGIVDQVVEGDQGVGLAAAVGELQLAHGLVVLARQAQHDVPGQLAQVVGGVGEGEELAGIFVDAAPASSACATSSRSAAKAASDSSPDLRSSRNWTTLCHGVQGSVLTVHLCGIGRIGHYLAGDSPCSYKERRRTR